jgi:DNA (cytosine-5)-methyltransferase 1
MKNREYRLIDLFSGAGGLSLRFSEAFGHKFRPVWANDMDEDAVASYNLNFGKHCIYGDIVDLLSNPDVNIPKADVVIGGPPCQGFSLLNKNRDDDPRKHLWRPFLEVVKRSGAEVFVMENVPQLLGSEEYEDIIGTAQKMGFKTAAATLLAADYGVPQTRYRAFILGCRFADLQDVFPPPRTHFKSGNGIPQRTLFKLNGDYVDEPRPWRTGISRSPARRLPAAPR